MWILYTFLWPWVHAQSCLCTPPTQPRPSEALPQSCTRYQIGVKVHKEFLTFLRPHREGKQSAAGTGKVALGRERTVAVIQWNQPTCLNGSQNDAL